MFTFALIFFAALLVSFILTPLVRDRAMRVGMVDIPKEDRQIHTLPVARAGGVGIFISFVLSLSLLFFISNQVSNLFHAELPKLVRLLLPCSLIFLLGLIDDIYRLTARTKFFVQVGAALLFYFTCGGIKTLGNPFTGTLIDLGWLALPITLLWLVGITNAFNLIDGIDGLSAGSALFATLAMLCVAMVNGNMFIILLTCALAGAILGFLKYNFNPATIFMGDCGSLFIGFTLAALAILGAQKSTTVVAVAIPVVSFGLPIMETLLSMARRFLARQPLFAADRRHIHHQLLAKGLSHRQVVIVLYGVSALFGMLSLLMIESHARTIGLILLILGISVWIGIQHLGYHEFGEVSRLFQRSLRQRAIIANNISIHNAVDSFAEANTPKQLFDQLNACFQIIDFNRVELRVPRHFFPNFEEHAHFTVRINRNEFVATWLNESAEPSTIGQNHMAELRMPLCCSEELCQGMLIFARTFQSEPVMFDINLLFNNLRTKLEIAIRRVSEKTISQQPSGEFEPAKLLAFSSDPEVK
ncbi:MAG: MraY family glycosyltransferase [Acidobacteriota bacterium]